MSLDLRSCAVGAAAGAAVVLGALAVHGALARGGRDAAADSASGGGFAKKTREGEDVRSTTASGTYLGGSGSSVYESARAVGEYLAFHYAPPAELCPFPTCAPAGACVALRYDCLWRCACNSRVIVVSLLPGCW
jgi:hypothetical protein